MPTGIYKRVKGGIYKNCIICNNKFYVYPCDIKHKKFCSKKCYGTWTSKNIIGIKHHFCGKNHIHKF